MNDHSLFIEKYANQLQYNFINLSEEINFKRTNSYNADDYKLKSLLVHNSKYFLKGNDIVFSSSIENLSRTEVYAEAVFELLDDNDRLFYGLNYFSCGESIDCKNILPCLFIPASAILFRKIQSADYITLFIGVNFRHYNSLKDSLSDFITYESRGGIITKFNKTELI